jgi:UDP-2,3-diacylglucosamine hydrolase
MARTLFIADLHLCAERPAINELFLHFLRASAADADALYILGDLFEYWIGDEAVAQREFAPLIEGLRELTDGGTPVYVVRGNRDFLLGAGFERASGCRLLPDPTCITFGGTRAVISHGDALCTGDLDYMHFRALVRHAEWQREFLAKSVEERMAIARSFREASKNSTAAKKPEIMDVAQTAVDSLLRRVGMRTLIHGHTHRPADHRFTLDGHAARRIVLGDWYEQGSVLTCDANGWRLETIPLSAAPGALAARTPGL